jgi:hypothetical protein
MAPANDPTHPSAVDIPEGTAPLPDSLASPGVDATAQPAPASPGGSLWAPDTGRGKFRAAHGVLAVILLVAVAGFVGLLLQGGPAAGPAWSAFQPQQAGVAGAQEIADYVRARYLFEDETPLVDIDARPLSLQDEPVSLIAIQRTDNGRSDPLILDNQNAIEYGLCGDPAEKCAILKGTPSRERLRLLSRASLELALYTFRYLDGIDSVVTFLPPPQGQDPTWAIFFRRSDLEPMLEQPLTATLADAVPAHPADIPPSEVSTIDAVTGPHRFQYSFQQLEDGTPVLVLDDSLEQQ